MADDGDRNKQRDGVEINGDTVTIYISNRDGLLSYLSDIDSHPDAYKDKKIVFMGSGKGTGYALIDLGWTPLAIDVAKSKFNELEFNKLEIRGGLEFSSAIGSAARVKFVGTSITANSQPAIKFQGNVLSSGAYYRMAENAQIIHNKPYIIISSGSIINCDVEVNQAYLLIEQGDWSKGSVVGSVKADNSFVKIDDSRIIGNLEMNRPPHDLNVGPDSKAWVNFKGSVAITNVTINSGITKLDGKSRFKVDFNDYASTGGTTIEKDLKMRGLIDVKGDSGEPSTTKIHMNIGAISIYDGNRGEYIPDPKSGEMVSQGERTVAFMRASGKLNQIYLAGIRGVLNQVGVDGSEGASQPILGSTATLPVVTPGPVGTPIPRP